MGQLSGKYQYLDPASKALQDGPCQLQFDAQTFTLSPESGAALMFDLGDIDALVAADFELRIALYTGNTIVLKQLGKAFDNLAHDLLEAFRRRTLQCLLLEDLQEIDRFTGNFETASPETQQRSGAAEFRLYQSNLAVLPQSSAGFQWRLADVDSVQFDAANYSVSITSGNDKLIFSRLAKRTEEFATKLRDAIREVSTSGAQSLHQAFPFLNPDQLQSVSTLMKEGGAAPVTKLAAIDPRIPEALSRNAVDGDLKPYYDQLLSRTAGGMLYAGFKLIRPEDSANGDSERTGAQQAGSEFENRDTSVAGDCEAPDTDDNGPEMLYWFFFPIAAKTGTSEPSNVVAWEASSRSGRATYFFRLLEPSQGSQRQNVSDGPNLVDSSIRRLNRALAMLNFRRRPIYLSDDELQEDPRFYRYAIACRRLPELRDLRAHFLGRIFHTSPDAWQSQVNALLAKVGV